MLISEQANEKRIFSGCWNMAILVSLIGEVPNVRQNLRMVLSMNDNSSTTETEEEVRLPI